MCYSWNQKPWIRACEVHEMAKKQSISEMCQIWIEARMRYHLSDAQIHIACELGLNPHKFGKLANKKREPWKKKPPGVHYRDLLQALRKKVTGCGTQYRATGSGSAREEGRTKSA